MIVRAELHKRVGVADLLEKAVMSGSDQSAKAPIPGPSASASISPSPDIL
jgi:hypothetical protein